MKTSPWARRQARRALVQALYQWQMSGTKVAQVIVDFEANGSLKKADRDFFHELLHGVVAPGAAAPVDVAAQDPATAPTTTVAKSNKTMSRCAIDAVFTEFLDRAPQDLDKVELAILRLGSYELQHRIGVPYKVVIDEYVELTKLFGAEEAHKYINGVLDNVASITREVEVQARAGGNSLAKSESGES